MSTAPVYVGVDYARPEHARIIVHVYDRRTHAWGWGGVREGHVVVGERTAELAALSAEFVSLPVDVVRLGAAGLLGALGAYQRRSYGVGAEPPAERPGHCCPMAVWVGEAGRHALHFAVGLRALPGVHRVHAPARGALRLASGVEPGVGAVSGSEVVDVDDEQLDAAARPSIVLTGSATLTAGEPGLVGLSLFGRASGVAVEWVALTVTAPR